MYSRRAGHAGNRLDRRQKGAAAARVQLEGNTDTILSTMSLRSLQTETKKGKMEEYYRNLYRSALLTPTPSNLR